MFQFRQQILGLVVFVGLIVSCGETKFNLAPETDAHIASVSYNKQVDILWVIDNSDSMLQHQSILAQKSSEFIDGLLIKGLDFRIAATTTDMSGNGEKGRFIGSPKVLDSNTLGLRAQFAKLLSAGDSGSSLEQGLAAIKASYEKRNDVNGGFFRDDALLVIIVLTNEDDASPDKTSDYVNFLNSKKSPTKFGDRNWIFHHIGVLGTPQEDCTTFGQYKDPGYRYMDLVSASSGVNTTICTADLKQALTNVSQRILEIVSVFILERKPVLGTIKVYVNGLAIGEDPENGWTYSAEENSVRLHGAAILRSDAAITIDYDPEAPK